MTDEPSTKSPPPEPEPWQLEDALASWEFILAEAKRRHLAGEPPWPFFETTKWKNRMAHAGGRPPFEPTDKDRRLVKEMASCGTPQDGIARTIGVTRNTLRKHFKDELERAEDEANFRVAQFMFGTIMGAPIQGVPPVTEGPTRASLAMFWAKTRMGWKETSMHEHGGKDGAPFIFQVNKVDAKL